MTLALALLVPSADACGGFACAAAQPVLQAAERIVFGVDEERGEVEMHVQITYSGPSEEFSWIVPVPQEPDLFLTTTSLFTQMALATQPRFTLNTIDEGHCRDQNSFGFGQEFDMAAAPRSGASSTSGGVQVVGQESIGPYETVTLRAANTEALLGWLDDNGYDIPATLESALIPYVMADGYFVALKLAKDRDAGDLAPLAMRYRADKATIPVQLTSVSATPDMRVEAYVLGDGRGVPESYFHVKINDAAVDWWTQGSNYGDVITQAANEAGGHAFATDYYGGVDIVGRLWDDASWNEAAVRGSAGPYAWVEQLRGQLIVVPPELFQVLEDQLGLAPGAGANFWACPDCGTEPSGTFDAGVATDDLVERVIEPLQSDQALLDRFPHLARLTSSLDAIEMDVDPVFVLNHDLAGTRVRRAHSADLVYRCGNGRLRSEAKRRLVLADGREINLPSETWFAEERTTEFEYIAELGDQKAQVIEQMGPNGEPVVISDFTDDFRALTDRFNRGGGCGQGGGCSTGGPVGAGALVGLVALALRRRRS